MTAQVFSKPGSGAWILTLAALAATAAMSIDMSLPAQPRIAVDLGVGRASAQLTLSLFLVGFAFGQLVVGQVSDALGRRRALLVWLGLYAAGGVCAALSPTIALLCAMRVVQGFGAAGGPVIGRAMIRDTQPTTEAARLLATLMSALAIAPMVAPSIGGALLVASGWRAIFAVLAIFGALLVALAWGTLAETLPAERRVAFAPAALARNLWRVVRTPGIPAPIGVVCLLFGGQFAFISDSPFVFMEHHGASPTRYAIYFGLTALSLMAGAALGGRLLRRRGPREVVRIGATLLLAGGVATALLPWLAPGAGAVALLAPAALYFHGVGMTGPSATALALEPVPWAAGTASALLGALQMLSGAISGALATRLAGSDPATLGLVIGAYGSLAALLAHRALR